jgi:UDP-N-acetylglucosamine 2-epimerase (non-hydrolysing)
MQKLKYKILIVFGTRPEAIKISPLIRVFRLNPKFDLKICITGQHREMLDQFLKIFDIHPDFDLNIMKLNQSLSDISTAILSGMQQVYESYTPDMVLVHGDTTTSFAASLASFYANIPIAHIEAGLRTHNIKSPWPEEANRRLNAVLATLHFTPTFLTAKNLFDEGVDPKSVFITGNTVIDSLLQTVEYLQDNFTLLRKIQDSLNFIRDDAQILLVTSHRRENIEGGLDRICSSLRLLVNKFPNLQIVFPVHLNPRVRGQIEKALSDIPNIWLTKPLDYFEFVYLLKISTLILTDSGGIQEEAPSLGKPVLVLRENSERPEAIAAGTARLVGTDIDDIVNAVSELLSNELEYKKMSLAHNPYGDGRACTRIIDGIIEYFELSNISCDLVEFRL